VRVERGRASHPDLVFTQDRATAEAIHRGELSAQAAFMQGRLRLGGDLRAVVDRAGELTAVHDVFASVRA
jgi:putative sterol carrier protein